MKKISKKELIEILLHLIFWVGVFYILTSLSRTHIVRQTQLTIGDQDKEPISTYVYWIVGFLMLFFYGNIFWVIRKIIRYKNIFVRLAICVAWFVLVFGANYVAVGPMFGKANMERSVGLTSPTDPPGFMMKEDPVLDSKNPDLSPGSVVNFRINNWNQLQPILLLAFLVILGVSIAYFFLKAWAKSELKQTQLQAHQYNTEIQFLKSQINPHFLFNTLNNLFSMAQQKENDELADGISKLSGMMRYMLYESNAEKVPLNTEIKYLEEFIMLNKLRYSDDEVNVVFTHPSNTGRVNVAPMLFIPFVENAFKHGVMIGRPSTILIDIRVSEETMIFVCENTKYSKNKPIVAEKSGIGLENIKRRLELLYPGKHRLQIPETGEHYKVQLEIKLT